MEFSVKNFIFFETPEQGFSVLSPIYIENFSLRYWVWADDVGNNKFSIFEESP